MLLTIFGASISFSDGESIDKAEGVAWTKENYAEEGKSVQTGSNEEHKLVSAIVWIEAWHSSRSADILNDSICAVTKAA